MTTEQRAKRNITGNGELLWFAGALGTAIGLAVWAYNRRELTYWEKTKRVATQVGENASEINPWVGIGTATLGCAALAYRLRKPKSSWDKASEHAGEFLSQTAKQLRPWPGIIAGAATGAASAALDAPSRKKAIKGVTDAVDRFAHSGSRILRHLQTISSDAFDLYGQIRKAIA